MDLNIKDAFQRAKQDINFLKDNILDLHKELNEIQNSILQLFSLLDSKTNSSTDRSYNSAFRQINKTSNSPTINSFNENLLFKDYKQGIITSSSGNKGVSTDRQTIRQTDNQNVFPFEIPEKPLITPSLILSQLDILKKELRFKIKKLTKQELLVFSSIYQFEDQGKEVNYSLLSNKLNLSESSIRDYTQRIITKGIPLLKKKINNKQIILYISPDFKKIATLDTVLNLRNL